LGIVHQGAGRIIVGQLYFDQFFYNTILNDDKIHFTTFLVADIVQFTSVAISVFDEMASLQQVGGHQVFESRPFISDDICIVEEVDFGWLLDSPRKVFRVRPDCKNKIHPFKKSEPGRCGLVRYLYIIGQVGENHEPADAVSQRVGK
jgi:hypothetical protein